MTTEPLFGVGNGQTDTVLATIDRYMANGATGCDLATLLVNGLNKGTADTVLGALVRSGAIKATLKGSKATVVWKEYSRA